jgi:hypothetical protein
MEVESQGSTVAIEYNMPAPYNSKLSLIETEFEEYRETRQAMQLSTDFGLILNIDSEPEYPLDFRKLDISMTLRVTLSYFIDPNPGSRTWHKNPKYRYPSCLLRFRVKHKDQSTQQFRLLLERAIDNENWELDA